MPNFQITSLSPLRKLGPFAAALALALTGGGAPHAVAAIDLIATGTLSLTSDLSGLSGTLEDGLAADVFSGGSALAWAGGNTFISLPDRGPNKLNWDTAHGGSSAGTSFDNTTSYIARMHTVELPLIQSFNGSTYSYSLTPSLTGTTLLSSPTALNYGAVSTISGGTNYFSGRSDNFLTGSTSLNSDNARLDPEGIRVSNDGTKVYISDEYGPYVYEFNRATGARTRVFTLPAHLTIANQSKTGATEISGNTSGRVTNKGMEGLAITPDGTTLFGFMQSPLLQDGGDVNTPGPNRIIRMDIASGTVTGEFAYNDDIGGAGFNSSEMLALNDHELLVLERDGKGLGAGNNAAVKSIFKLSIAGATDVSALSGSATLLADAPTKSLFLDIKAVLNAHGVTNANIPSKLEGLAWGQDVVEGATTYHTLYITNDNDFDNAGSGPNQFYVFKVSDADLGGSTYVAQAVPEPATLVTLLGGVGMLALRRRRRA